MNKTVFLERDGESQFVAPALQQSISQSQVEHSDKLAKGFLLYFYAFFSIS